MNEQRKNCLTYITEHHDTWPKPHSTDHTGATSFGYGWHQAQVLGEWTLVHRETGDVITKQEFIDFDITEHEYKIPKQIWISFNKNGSICKTSVDRPKNLEDAGFGSPWVPFLLGS